MVSTLPFRVFDALHGTNFRRGDPLSSLSRRKAESAYQVTVDGQPVFVHRFLTYDQFNWMDYASFGMTGKVHVTITMLVSERKVLTCNVRPLAYGIQPQINGNTVSFDLDRPHYLVLFLNDEPAFNNPGLILFAEPPEQNPSDSAIPTWSTFWTTRSTSRVKTIETAKINQAISDVSGKPGGGVLLFSHGRRLPDRHIVDEEQRQALRRRGRADSGDRQDCGLHVRACSLPGATRG